MVELRTLKDGIKGTRIDYDIFKKGKTVDTRRVKEELKDELVILSQKGIIKMYSLESFKSGCKILSNNSNIKEYILCLKINKLFVKDELVKVKVKRTVETRGQSLYQKNKKC